MTADKREDLIARSYAAFNAGNGAAWPELYSADVVWSLTGDNVVPGLDREYHGLDGLARFRQDWFEVWEDPTVRRAETMHLPDDRVLIDARAAGRIQGVELELRIWQVGEFSNGRISKVVHYFEEDAARAAAGLA